MTKYPQVNSHSGKSKFRQRSTWKQFNASQKWRNYAAIFIAVILIFATMNGFLKSVSIRNFLSDLRRDSNSSFVAMLSTSPPSVFIYQSDPKRIVFLSIPDEMHLFTGRFKEPLVKLGNLVNSKDGKEMARVATINFGTGIGKYVIFNDALRIDQLLAEKLFKNFASITTPITVLGGNKSLYTNITLGEQIGLWWQIKGLSVDQVSFVDLSAYSEEIVLGSNQRVLGVDEVSLKRAVKEYLENQKVIEAGLNIEIENASGVNLAGGLAGDLISSVGFDVADIRSANSVNARTLVLAGEQNSYEAKLLASILDCDILGAEKEGITVVVGQDFARRYFE